MTNNEWGVQKGSLSLQDSFMEYVPEGDAINEYENIVLGSQIKFPLKFLYQVIFVGGKRGSGKSYTAGVMMEELERLGLQYVCFDALDAHGGLVELGGVERITPVRGESVNMVKLTNKLRETQKSLIINISEIPLEQQQSLISEYCETLLSTDMDGRGLMTIFEECQDFVPQMGRPESFHGIVRLCKLGRSKGYGSALISQRPAAVSKEALSQASIYMVHNVINTKDINALKEQMSFGTDTSRIEKILDGIGASEPGEVVVYAPEFLKDEGYITVGRIDRDRRTEHKGKNIDVRPKSVTMFSPVNSGDSSFEETYDSYGSDEEDEFSDKVFDSFDYSESEDSSIDKRYNFDDEEMGEEFTLEDSLTWIAEELENEKVITKPNTGLKFVAGIAFLTGGIFLATRRISRID
tara:strand:- start:6873 stop:8099 length:1227 start_codon:yes stop_codon:yes gene_type:complete